MRDARPVPSGPRVRSIDHWRSSALLPSSRPSPCDSANQSRNLGVHCALARRGHLAHSPLSSPPQAQQDGTQKGQQEVDKPPSDNAGLTHSCRRCAIAYLISTPQHCLGNSWGTRPPKHSGSRCARGKLREFSISGNPLSRAKREPGGLGGLPPINGAYGSRPGGDWSLVEARSSAGQGTRCGPSSREPSSLREQTWKKRGIGGRFGNFWRCWRGGFNHGLLDRDFVSSLRRLSDWWKVSKRLAVSAVANPTIRQSPQSSAPLTATLPSPASHTPRDSGFRLSRCDRDDGMSTCSRNKRALRGAAPLPMNRSVPRAVILSLRRGCGSVWVVPGW